MSSKKNSAFIKSAVEPKDYPEGLMPEVAMVGRSNSGKSSLVNAWFHQKKLAHISSQPGKTRLLNFFDVRGSYRLVDMPGYGFAARSTKEKKLWQEMIENYFSLRSQLRVLILIMDIRRDWTVQESQICDFMAHIGKPVVVVLNKIDKANRSIKTKAPRAIKELGFPVKSISALQKSGVDELKSFIWDEYLKDDLK